MSGTQAIASQQAAAASPARYSQPAPRRILILNQCFYPDVVSTAQHAADLASGLSNAGHAVTVIASQRAYDNPAERFRPAEVWNGVHVVRVWCSGLGKRGKWRRVCDFASFLASCTLRLASAGRFDVVVAMTSPPLISCIGAVFARFTGADLNLWVMDLNPDEAVAAGWLRAGAPMTRVLQRLLLYSLRRSTKIIVLDRFMKERIVAKGIEASRITVLPPWSHDGAVRYDPSGRDAFRAQHGLSGKYVVMYSGNHSPCHPLDTLLEAALRIRDTANVVFCFIGGGSDFSKAIRFACEHNLSNIVTLPYQRLDMLSASLSAADLHVVVMGEPFVGIVHPCKVYNIVNLRIPFLYIGPTPSHVTDLLSNEARGLSAGVVRHGDIDGVVRCILNGARPNRPVPKDGIMQSSFSQHLLVPQMVSVLIDSQS